MWKALLANPDQMKLGKAGYERVCATCHGKQGEGLIGPNLTDAYWIYSKGEFDSILVALREGFPAKGMPPWKDIIPKNEHGPIAAYTLSLQGTNPPNAKPPQGEEVKK